MSIRVKVYMDIKIDPDEYAILTLSSDGNLPTANYTGTFSDDANKGQEAAWWEPWLR